MTRPEVIVYRTASTDRYWISCACCPDYAGGDYASAESADRAKVRHINSVRHKKRSRT